MVRKPHPIGGRASVTERRIHVGLGMIGLSNAVNLLAAGLEPILFESGEQAVARGQVRIFSPWYWDLDPAATALLKSVGVVVDGRRYEWVIGPARRRDHRLHDRPLGAPAV